MSTFISYAQNFEDVILYRALKSVERGCYVDVGANDPTTDSVTQAFYERGWRGINIEPVGAWFKLLQAARPDDHNFNVAAGRRTERIKLFEIVDTGLSTAIAATAERHRNAGWQILEREVPCRRLDDICDECGISEIHFLKIDVEGAEPAVLEGFDLTRLRPWIILVEATEPGSPQPNHETWEPLLTARGYEFVQFDGLNRFYVDQSRKAELAPALILSPNVYDSFMRHSEAVALQQAAALPEARRMNEVLRVELGEAKRELERLREDQSRLHQNASVQAKELVELQQTVQARDVKIAFLRNTLSWRITAPIRWIGHTRKKMGARFGNASQCLLSLPPRLAKRMKLALRAYPGRKRWLKRLERMPKLRAWLIAIFQVEKKDSISFAASGRPEESPGLKANHPASVRYIYTRLLQAREAVRHSRGELS